MTTPIEDVGEGSRLSGVPTCDAEMFRHIATAPRDGTHFEARCDNFAPFDCYFDGWIFAHDDPDDGTINYRPNLWRPYPADKARTASASGDGDAKRRSAQKQSPQEAEGEGA